MSIPESILSTNPLIIVIVIRVIISRRGRGLGSFVLSLTVRLLGALLTLPPCNPLQNFCCQELLHLSPSPLSLF